MCFSNIYGGPRVVTLSHFFREREREMDSSNVALMKIVPLIFLSMTILDFLVMNEDLIKVDLSNSWNCNMQKIPFYESSCHSTEKS